MTDKIGITEIYDILFYSIPNRWSKQPCVQGFDFGYIYFNKAVNMFESMEIAEGISEGVVAPYN